MESKSMIFLDAYIPQDGKRGFDLIPGLRNIDEQRRLKEEAKIGLYSPIHLRNLELLTMKILMG